MLGEDLKQEDFKSRKEYLVHLAVLYIREHTGYVGVNDDIYFDEANCDGLALANDLCYEFELEDLEE